MTTDAQKRDYVASLYSGPRWKQKVAHMPDHQVTAIYLKHVNDGQTPESYSEMVEMINDPSHLVIRPRNPHENEDEFELF